MIRVLAIDDQEQFRVALRQMFARYDEARGCSLETLDRLPEGDSYLDHPDPDVLILDLGLPGSGGANTVRRARKLWPSVPIVVVTAADVNGESDAIRDAGAVGVFQKAEVAGPSGFRTLLAAIKRAVVEAGNIAAETTLTQTMNRIDMEPVVEHFDRKVRSVRRTVVALASLLGTLGGGGAVAWQALRGEPDKQVEAPAWFKSYEERQDAVAAQAELAEVAAKSAVGEVKNLDQRLQAIDGSLKELKGYLRGLTQSGRRGRLDEDPNP